jgi:hypothetical protein
MIGSSLRLLALGMFALSGIFAALGPPTSAQAQCSPNTITIPTFKLVGPGTYQGAGTTTFNCGGQTVTGSTVTWEFGTEGSNALPGITDQDATADACTVISPSCPSITDKSPFSFQATIFAGATPDGISCPGSPLPGGGPLTVTPPATQSATVNNTTSGTYCIRFVSSDPLLSAIAAAHPGVSEIDVIDYGELNSLLNLQGGGSAFGANGDADAFISAAVPELDSVMLFGAGFVGLVGFGWYQRRKKVA